MASRLLFAGVTPTLLDVIGAPLPRMPAFTPKPAHGQERFGDLFGKAVSAHAPTSSPVLAESQTSSASVKAPRGIMPSEKAALKAAIHKASTAAEVDPALSVAVARAESSLNPRARSSDGLSVGTFQVTDATAAEMHRKIAAGTVERPPGTDDVALGVGYLRYLDDLFAKRSNLGGKLKTVAVEDGTERRLFAIAAFNAGEGRVAQAQAKAVAIGHDPTRFEDIRRFLPTITRGYVDRVAAYQREEATGSRLA